MLLLHVPNLHFERISDMYAALACSKFLFWANFRHVSRPCLFQIFISNEFQTRMLLLHVPNFHFERISDMYAALACSKFSFRTNFRHVCCSCMFQIFILSEFQTRMQTLLVPNFYFERISDTYAALACSKFSFVTNFRHVCGPCMFQIFISNEFQTRKQLLLVPNFHFERISDTYAALACFKFL